MNAHYPSDKPSRFWLFCLAAVLIVSLATMQSFQKTHAADGESAIVTYSHSTVRATVPYNAPHAGSGKLVLEVLNPEDEVLGRSERVLEIAEGKGSWQADVKLAKAPAIDDLAWHRLRYRFTY